MELGTVISYSMEQFTQVIPQQSSYDVTPYFSRNKYDLTTLESLTKMKISYM